MKFTVRALGRNLLELELTAHPAPRPDRGAPTLEASGHTGTERADPEMVTTGFAPGWATSPLRRSQSEPDPTQGVTRCAERGSITSQTEPAP